MLKELNEKHRKRIKEDLENDIATKWEYKEMTNCIFKKLQSCS